MSPNRPSTPTVRTSRLVALLALLAIVMAACGNGDGTGAPRVNGGDDDWVTCESSEQGYRIDHPPGWETNEGEVMPPCSLFDPEPIDVEGGTEIPTDIAVAITLEPAAARAGGLGERILSEEEAEVDGRTATRVEVEATGEALYPAGLRTTRWSVPVDGQRILARTHDRGELAYGEKQDVLDEMIETLVIRRPASTTTTAGPDEEGPEPVGVPATVPVGSGDFPAGPGTETAFLVDVRMATHGGFDRVVLELEGDEPPSYRIAYTDPPIRAAGSGHEVEIEGEAYLEIALQPATAVDLRGSEARETYEGPDRIDLPDGEVVREVVETGDFESHLTWVAGLTEEAPFAVSVLHDPLRLVIDVVPTAE